MSDVTGEPAGNDVSARALMQSLRAWQHAGLTHLPRVRTDAAQTISHLVHAGPVASDFKASSVAASERPAQTAGPPAAPDAAPVTDDSACRNRPSTASNADPQPSRPMPVNAPATVSPQSAAEGCALSRAERQQRLQAVATRVAACTRCAELASTRTQTVFGVGDPQARVMFIGEAPGADEDQQGEPFVGRAGQLLNRIITACGWRREEIYICNILRCRPPGNRNPSPLEAANCREYLDAQIAIVDPEYIVCWGSIAAQNLLGTEQPIGRLRGQWFQHGRARVLCTYHPSFLLRNPSAKRQVWDDMLGLLAAMGLQPPSATR